MDDYENKFRQEKCL